MAQADPLRGKRKLDDAYNEVLIDFVRNHPVLYEREFANSSVKEQKKCLWEKFTKQYDLKYEDCKVRWKSLRNRYFHNKKRLTTDPSAQRYRHADSLSFLDKLQPHNQKRNLTLSYSKNGKDIEIVKKSVENTNLNLGATVVTADMLLQILLMRQKEEDKEGKSTSVLKKHTLFQTHDDPSNELTPLIPSTSVADTLETISFGLPKFNFVDNPVSQLETSSSSSTLSATEDVIVIEDDGVSIDNNTVEDSRACITSLPIDGHNTDTFNKASNSDQRIIETQYKETENILKYNIEGLNANLDSGNDSTEKFFDEMGEYVENRFPKDKQQDLKCKIWNLLWRKCNRD